MATEGKKIKVAVPGLVKSNYVDSESNKRVISVWVDPDYSEWFEDLIASEHLEFSGDSYPLKTDLESGGRFIISRSKYEVSAKGLPRGYTINDIGKGSEVCLYVKLVEGEQRRQKYLSAYLMGVNVISFVEREDTDIFNDDTVLSMQYAADPR